jgi:hypothetical protein
MTAKKLKEYENCEIRIKRFDPKAMKRDATCFIYGKRRSGKSVLVRDLMYYLKDMPRGFVISESEKSNPFFRHFIPRSYIFDSYEKKVVEKIFQQQEKIVARENGPNEGNNCFMIMDDCLPNVQMWKKDETIRKCMFNGRHVNLLLFIVMQNCMALPPEFRGNFDYVFIFKDIILNNRKRLYENFAGIVPHMEIFKKLMDHVTDDHGCLVIDMTGDKNHWQECVYWYKAKMRDKFRVGCDEYWRIHDMHYNEYQAEEDDEDDNGGQSNPVATGSGPFKIVLRPMPTE